VIEYFADEETELYEGGFIKDFYTQDQ
jgi:hypothetical protein